MYVIAASGLKVPMENKPTTYIEGVLIVPVEDSAYYLRRISDKDLVEASAEEYQSQQDALAAAEAEATAKAQADADAAEKATKVTAKGAK